jgi:energy-coupling factor transporter ATP-binding protein EcfA2
MKPFVNDCPPKSVLVHGPQGCGKSTHAQSIAMALGLSNVLDDWQAGAAVPLLDTLVLTNAENPKWYFQGRVMTFDQAMQITQQGGGVA